MREELEGRLFFSDSGYLCLSVPNAIALGAYRALSAPGLTLPLRNGKLNAHITVMRPEEVTSIGGPSVITERGKSFKYYLNDLRSSDMPGNRSDYSRVWYFSVSSPQLSQLRRTYGLSGEPDVPFHVTVAYRKASVLYSNSVVKTAMKGLYAYGWAADIADEARR